MTHRRAGHLWPKADVGLDLLQRATDDPKRPLPLLPEPAKIIYVIKEGIA